MPDTLDGRFAILATITALTMLRLEAFGAAGDAESVALTERFVEVMDAEHREMGIGDPTIGKTVRKLVAAVAQRLDTWRAAAAGEQAWADAAAYSTGTGGAGAAHCAAELRALWDRLETTDLDALAQGRMA